MKPLFRFVGPFFCLLLAALSLYAGTVYRSVADFGADGSGTHDDTQAIQKAIDAVSATSGGVVFLPAGKYRISAPLIIEKGGVTLMGEGRGAEGGIGTMLTLESAKTATFIWMKGCSYGGIRNLTLERKGNQGSGADAAIKMEDTYHSFVKEVFIHEPINGVDIVNGISPILEDVDIKDPSGTFGIWIHGTGGAKGDYHKIDAGVFTRISGGSKKNDKIEWLVVGPNVDGTTVQYARFVEGGRALVLRGGDPANGDERPKYLHCYAFGSDHAANEAVLIEAGDEILMLDTWIGQNRHAPGFVIGPGFTGSAQLTNMRIRGSGGDGMHIMGGQNIYISNPLIGACAADKALYPTENTGCGILIDAGVKHLRVTGGGVCPLTETGPRSKQYYGVRYMGNDQQANADSIHISGVDTAGNPIPYAPQALSLDREP